MKKVQKNDITLLHDAAKAGDHEALTKLIKSGVDVNARDDSGGTALHKAAHSKSAENVKTLIEAGADVNAYGSFGATPLHTAARSRNSNSSLANKIWGRKND